MDPTRTSLFDLAQRRLSWLDQRQQVLARNVAHADTPGWQARDLRPFADILADGSGVAPARTSTRHLSGTLDHMQGRGKTLRAHARMPDGNDVSIEDQLTRVAGTETQQSLVNGVFRKYLGLFRIALGRSQ